ncbi:MAG: dTDP-glucose 4,6-dehydratase [Patescibacteria group bacterium]|nr:dTDP-glucose 4,6-dehydratase [Patescibacteria group bacterium]
MNLLVTGGAGFIGSNFIRYWLKKHKRDLVINLDKLTYAGHLSSTADFQNNQNYKFVKGDINNRALVDNIVSDCEIVVNFAAESHVDRSIKNSNPFIRTNINGVHCLLESARKNKIKRFHQVSTDEVFGSLNLSSHKKFNEESVYQPRSPYAASKAAADFLVRSYFHTFSLPITITNCSNNYGPFQDPEKLIPRFITNLLDGKKVPVYGDGLYVRDWLYVYDHCRAIEMVILRGKIGDTYCVGGQNKLVSNLELTKKILEILNKNGDFIEHISDRPGHDRKYAVNWNKIHHDLGWEPKFDLSRYLEETVNWYRNNRRWWQPLKTRSESLYR